MHYTVLQIPPGRRGTRSTLRIMAKLTRRAQLVPIVRETALAIVPRGNDPVVSAARIKDFVRVKIRHIDEPIEMLGDIVESFQSKSAGEARIAKNREDVLGALEQIACFCNPKT